MANQQNRSWNILYWNIKGLNSSDKCNTIRAKIEESPCAIFYIQEMKVQSFDHSLVRKMAPKRFKKLAFAPAEGASRGILMGWNDTLFQGQVIFVSKFSIIVNFSSTQNAEQWRLTIIYGPCQGQERQEFVQWLNSLDIDDDMNWLLLGNFNFYRSLENRNRAGGNTQDIMLFNEVISNLGFQEIPLKGRSYTWSNMQQEPLLEQLD
jgi:hypothetical protein